MKFSFFILSIFVSFISISTAHEEHLYGRPISFLLNTNSSDHSISTLDKLKQIFGHPEIEDRKVVILSIIGAYRKGKSFFLDYCLRFLYANYRSVNTLHNEFIKNENWWGGDDEPLTGFSWKHGSEPDTKGILFWNDVFLHDQEDEKIAIILVDTQGQFELEGTANLDAKIFAITSLISSVQIYNLNGVIQEDQLEHLKMVTDFSKRITNLQNEHVQHNTSKQFQNLLFLFRDWVDEDVGYGYEGGQTYLSRIFNVKNSTSRKAQSIRKSVNESYENLNAFLLPSPGNNVHKKSFNGNWRVLSDDFKKNLKILVESLLLPQNLIKKEILSKEYTAKEMINYTYSIFTAADDSAFLENVSILDLAIKTELMELSSKIISDYWSNLTKSINYTKPNFVDTLLDDHKSFLAEAIDTFKKTSKMADEVAENEFIDKMEIEINNKFDKFKEVTLTSYQKLIDDKIRHEEALKKQREEYARQIEIARQNHEARMLGIENYKRTAAYKSCRFFTAGLHHCGLAHM